MIPLQWRWSGVVGQDLHEALQTACRWLRPVQTYLEIGVDGGGSLHTVLLATAPDYPIRLVLCDVWDPTYLDHGRTKPIVEGMLAYFGLTDRTEFLDGDSKILIPSLHGVFDLITVDGDHSAEGAMADLEHVWPLLRSGGLLVMDDIAHPTYPWLGTVVANFLVRQQVFRIPELHGGCNAMLIRKP
ncbi:MAG: hypothetical protein C5B54_05705 [Acidobacteria bacterium]|nr:MAG: hypothetical protein C5B54_05705 [Acidobacteriota bacterium]